MTSATSAARAPGQRRQDTQRNPCDPSRPPSGGRRDAASKAIRLLLLLLPSTISCVVGLVAPQQDSGLHQVVPAHYQPSYVFGARNHSVNLTRVTLDELTGSVYVGATNWLFQVSSASLEPVAALRTGPTWENPRDCAPADCPAPLQPQEPALLPLYNAQSGDLSVPSSLGWRARHWPTIGASQSSGSGAPTNGTNGATSQPPPTKPHYNNHNKLLVVEPESRRLLVCGSLSQGACRYHQLGQLTNFSHLVPLPVAANDEHSSTVGLVVGGGGGASRRLLYVAATNTLQGQYRELVPAIAARHLEPGPKALQIVERSVTEAARVDISLGQREYFQVNYVGAFQHSDYLYFATVQRRTHEHQLEDWGYVSRLARLCSGDLSFQSYIEVSLECGPYNLLQDIYLAPAASHLSQQLGLATGQQHHAHPHQPAMVLVGVFARSKEPHGQRPSRKSAVCLYPMEQVERRFRDNINLCLGGHLRQRNMNYIAGHLDECPSSREPGATQEPQNLCSEPLKLNGSLPIRSQPLLTYDNELLTAVAVAQAPTAPLGTRALGAHEEPLPAGARHHQLLLLGTHEGYLKRVAVTSGPGGAGLAAHELDQLQVESQEPVLPDLLLINGAPSTSGPQFALVATSGKLAKVRWNGCRAAAHGSKSNATAGHQCQVCAHLQDPLCGWCSASQACVTRDECAHHWSPFDQIRCADYQPLEPEAVPVQVAAGSLVEVKVQTTGLVGGQLPAQLALQLASARFLCHYDYLTQQRGPSAALNTTPKLASTTTNTKAQQARLNPATSTVSIACPLPAAAGQRLSSGSSGSPLISQVSDTRLRLSVRPLEAEPELRQLLGLPGAGPGSLERELTLYDCSQHASCRTCLGAPQAARAYTCAWCPASNRCTFNASHPEHGCTAGALATTTPLSVNGHHLRPAQLAGSLDETQASVLGLALHEPNECPKAQHEWSAPATTMASASSRQEPAAGASNKWRGELLVPSGARRALQVPLERPLQELVPRGTRLQKLECELELEGTRSRFAARLANEGQLVVCQENLFHYHEETATVRGQLSLLLNDNNQPVETHEVLLYKCHLFGVNPRALASSIGQHTASSAAWRPDELLRRAWPASKLARGPQRSDCSLCMNVERRFQCQWCANQCQHADHCPAGLQASTCPPPRIDSIQPRSGPLEGGTLLTIEGSNLGANEREIQDKISVGGEPCQLLVYSVSTRIVCRVGPSAQGPHEATVFVGNRAGVTSAHEKFHYEAVHLSDVQPRQGPVSGGTRLTLTGAHLRTGSRTQVFLDELPCALVEEPHYDPNQISCITAPHLLASSMRISRLTLVIDNSTHHLPYPFTYQPDPVITSIEPTESFASGGRLILVTGQHLSSPLVTKLVVWDERNPSWVNSTNCYPQNDTLRTCLTPALDFEQFAAMDGSASMGSDTSRLAYAQGGLKLKMALYMDDVRSVRNLDEYYHHLPHHITYYEDPQLFRLERALVEYAPELVIAGENLQMKQLDQDMLISVGDKSFCQIKSVSSRQVVCVPPARVPPALDEQGYLLERHSLPIRALIGAHLRFDLGHMQYTSQQYLPLVTGSSSSSSSGQSGLQASGQAQSDLEQELGQGGFGAATATSGGVAILIILSVLGFVLGLAGFIVFARSSFRQSKAEREYRRIQLQMGSLDVNKAAGGGASLFSGANFHGFQGMPGNGARLKALDCMMNGTGNKKHLFQQPLFSPTTNHLADISTLVNYKPHQQHLVKLSSDGTIVNSTSIPARHLYSSTGDSSSSSQSSPSGSGGHNYTHNAQPPPLPPPPPVGPNLFCAGPMVPAGSQQRDLLGQLNSAHSLTPNNSGQRNYSWTQEAPSTIVPYAVIEACHLSLDNPGKPAGPNKDFV